MYKNKTILSVIPARKGSKGIPRKNVKLLAGKPLILYSVETALSSKLIDKTIVCSDDEEVFKICEKKLQIKRIGFLIEPSSLAFGDVQLEEVILFVLKRLWEHNNYVPGYVVLLEPTSPLRTGKDIDNAIRKLIDENGDSLLSVCENSSFFWSRNGIPINYDPSKRPRRQDKKWGYIENGCIYITKTELLKKYGSRLAGRILFYVMPREVSWDLDTLYDWEIVEFLLKKKESIMDWALREMVKTTA